MRIRKALAVIMTIPVAFILAACAPTSDMRKADDTNPPAAQPVDENDKAAPKPTAAAESEPAPPAAAKGTRENPGTPGVDVITFSEGDAAMWDVGVGAANFDAWPIIQAENMFNEPAPAGFQYVMLPVSTTYLGPDTGLPWLDIRISFVSADGRSFDNASVVIPGNLNEIAELYAGGVGAGNIAFLVPSDALTGGTWAVEYGFFSDPMFFAAV